MSDIFWCITVFKKNWTWYKALSRVLRAWMLIFGNSVSKKNVWTCGRAGIGKTTITKSHQIFFFPFLKAVLNNSFHYAKELLLQKLDYFDGGAECCCCDLQQSKAVCWVHSLYKTWYYRGVSHRFLKSDSDAQCWCFRPSPSWQCLTRPTPG